MDGKAANACAKTRTSKTGVQNPQAIAQARQLIQAAFLELYEQRDVRDIAVEALAKHAGYSRAAFYRYFHSVRDVLNAVEDDALPQQQTDYLVSHADAITPALFIQIYLEYFDAHERELRILLARDADEAFFQKLSGTIYPAFYAISQQLVAATPDERDRTVAYLVQSKMNQLRSWARNPQGKLSEYMYLPLATIEKSFWNGSQAKG